MLTDPLCHFSHRFPDLAARILHRDRHKRRNFREETVTDLLMAGLTAFEPFGLRVDFPLDESITGEDMDWEFVAPHATNGRRYLRLHIQAKRAIFKELKRKTSYWFYRELDHEAQKNTGHGSQAERLISGASSHPECVPLYMFYHTLDALEVADKSRNLPAIEGVSAMFADVLAPILAARPPANGNGRWPVDEKKIETWRRHFMPLSDFLCFDGKPGRLSWSPDGSVALLAGPRDALFSPGELADRLNERRMRFADEGGLAESPGIEASDTIPPQTGLALENWASGIGRAEIPRPRAIFLSLEGLVESTDHPKGPEDA